MYNTAPSGTCGYYTYWDGVPIDSLEFYTRPNRTIVAFPTNDQQAAIFVEWTHGEFHTFRADLERNFVQTLEEIAPNLAERVRGGSRAHRFMGSGDMPNFFRKPYGPGWALVGDAGFHKDPITAQGITDAFRDAEFLAAAIDCGLSGRQPLIEALAGYEQQRNDAIGSLYEFICDRATLAPFPLEFQQVLAALRDNQEALNRFFGVIQNTIPFREFFSPENLMQILTQGSLAEATAL
jgi:2-polyprenyl-6-methoxyphenol hydroxylase-like FAD-dependent oxidoreductase